MKKSWLEKKLDNRLKEHASDFDLEAAWEDLEKFRRPARRNRKVYFFFLFAAAMLVGVLLDRFVFTIQSPQVVQNVEQTQVDTKKDLIDLSNTDTEVNNSVERNEGNLAKSSTEESFEKSNHVPSTLFGLSTPKTKVRTPVESRTLTSKPYEGQYETVSAQQDSQKDQMKSVPSAFSKSENKSTDNNNSKSKQINNNTQKESYSKRNALTTALVSSLPTKSIGQLSPFSLKEKWSPITVKEESTSTLDNVINPSSPERFSIAFVAGYGKLSGSLTATDPALDSYIAHRNEKETALDYITATVKLRKTFLNHFFVESGVSYFRGSSVYKNAFDNSSTEILEDQTIAINRYSNGDEEPIIGDVEVTNYESVDITTYQTQQLIGVPVTIGAYLSLGKKWEVGISAGASYLFNTSHSGLVQSKNLEPKEFENLDEHGFKNGGLLRGLGQVEIAYALSRNWDLTANIHGGIDLSARKAEGYSTQYQNIGIGLGIRKSF